MSEQEQKTLEAVIVAALERKPLTAVPADFASRVAAAIPAKRESAAKHFGRPAAIGGGTVLAVALFVLAPHTAPSFSNLAFDGELMLVAELAALAWWMSVRRDVWE